MLGRSRRQGAGPVPQKVSFTAGVLGQDLGWTGRLWVDCAWACRRPQRRASGVSLGWWSSLCSGHPVGGTSAATAMLIGSYRYPCLLYTSDAADEEDSVDLGGRRIIKK